MDGRTTLRARKCKPVPSCSSLVLKTRVHVTSLKGKSNFVFNTHYRKKSVKIKSLVEQGAIPFDIFGYYSLSTFPVFIFTLPTSSNISHRLLSNKFERCWNQISELPQASFLKVMFNTRDDSQRQFFCATQRHNAGTMLQSFETVVVIPCCAKNRHCESFCVRSP